MNAGSSLAQTGNLYWESAITPSRLVFHSRRHLVSGELYLNIWPSVLMTVLVAMTDITALDASILSTDFAPCGQQAVIIRAQIASQQSQFNALSSELDILLHHAQELREQIGRIEGTLRINEGLLSPSRRVAPEILGQIFLYCLPTGDIVTTNPGCAPLLVFHVCRRWRRIAGQTPRLWERLHLGRDFSHEPRTLVPLWLKNSGTLPLDIRFSIQEWTTGTDPRLLEQDLIRLLAPNIHRCRSLAGSASIFALEQLFGRDMLLPCLENLDLWLPPWSVGVMPDLGILQTPCLQTISLHDVGFVTNALPNTLPLVRRLQLTGQESFGLLSHSSSLNFIALCPSLQSCTLTLSKDPGGPLRPPVVLESLRCLHLVFQFCLHDPVPFLKSLHTSFIEQLTLQNHGGVSPVPHIRRVLSLLLSARPHTIKRLKLYSLFVATSDWVPSLRELSELTSLTILGDSLDEGFFEALTADTPSDPWSCPRLADLILHHVSGLIGRSGDRLVAFIRSRAPVGPDGRKEIKDGRDLLRYVSLTLCNLEKRHEDQLRDIETQSCGALRLDGLGPPL